METYKGKTILITGASSGIGECFAYNLNKMGAKLILTARSEDKLLHIASNMNDAHVFVGDLSEEKFAKDLYDKIKNENLVVDILINNAGFGYSGKFLDTSMDNYKEMINLNICSLVHLTHLFLQDMVEIIEVVLLMFRLSLHFNLSHISVFMQRQKHLLLRLH